MQPTTEDMKRTMEIIYATSKVNEEFPNVYDKPIEFECPFCKGKAIMIRRRKRGHYARCPKCFTLMS